MVDNIMYAHALRRAVGRYRGYLIDNDIVIGKINARIGVAALGKTLCDLLIGLRLIACAVDGICNVLICAVPCHGERIAVDAEIGRSGNSVLCGNALEQIGLSCLGIEGNEINTVALGLDRLAIERDASERNITRMNDRLAAYARKNADGVRGGVLPLCVDNEVASCNKSLEASLAPIIGQAGADIDIAVMALEQHLCDTCGTAEVTVYLERRVRIKEIRICTSADKEAQTVVALLAFARSRPCVDAVSDRPAGLHVLFGAVM